MSKFGKYKLRATIILVLTFVVCGMGLFLSLKSGRAANAVSEVNAASLWENVEGFTVENNVDVPDYMKYGKYSTVYSSQEMSSVSNDEEQNLEDWELNGVKITSEIDNKSISFKNTVDISNFKTYDEFLTFTPLTSNRGAYDYTEIQFVLQDADDEDNYLKITVKYNRWYWASVIISAETPNIEASGYRWGDSVGGEVYYGLADRCFIGAFQGYTQETKYSEKDIDVRHRAIKLHYDTAEKLLSVTCQSGEVRPVLDLDDGHSVGYGNEWKGFKNNRVKLSVIMRGFVADKAQMMFLNVFGQKMNGETLSDVDAPIFSFGEEAEAAPVAEVGKAYPIYTAQCLDVVSGETAYECAVISPSGKTINIADDAFVPTEGGYYTIKYAAADECGNKAEKTFSVLATTALTPITINAKADEGTFKTGDFISVYEATANGGSGCLKVTVSVGRIGGGETVEINDGGFTPLLGGKYCVVYTAVDYVGNVATKTLTYEVLQSDNVVVETVTELKRLFDGVGVLFPAPIAYDYSTRIGCKLNAQYEIAVYDKQNSRSVLDGGEFLPDKEKYGDSVKVEYLIYANNDTQKEKAVNYSYTVPIYATSSDGTATGQAEDYFIYDKTTFATSYNPDSNSGYIKFYTEQNGTHSIEFANPVRAERLSVDFALPAGEQNYESLTISLRDSVNGRIGFDLELIDIKTGADKDTKTYVRYRDVNYAMSGTGNSFDKKGEEVASSVPLSLKYTGGQILDYNGNVVLTPDKNVDGSAFNGFSSGKIYITFTFNGIGGESSIMLTQISTQTLYADYNIKNELIDFTDVVSPTIALNTDILDAYYLNQIVEVPSAEGYDVLSPNLSVYVTVKNPNGKNLYQKTLATEGLSFVMDMRGRYTITYEVEDASGNTTRKTYNISAKDSVAPTITIETKQLSCKAGKSLNLPNAIIQDDVDENPSLYIMIVTPSAKIISLGLSTAENPVKNYTFTSKGTYYIRYYAVDSSYNVTIKDIPVAVF